jgi:hypothetical protein
VSGVPSSLGETSVLLEVHAAFRTKELDHRAANEKGPEESPMIPKYQYGAWTPYTNGLRWRIGRQVIKRRWVFWTKQFVEFKQESVIGVPQ